MGYEPPPKSIYILDLSPGKDATAEFYVGISENCERRWYQHNHYQHQPWVRRNQLKSMLVLPQYKKENAKKVENKITRLLMSSFGKDAARGGRWSVPSLHNYPDTDNITLPARVAEWFENTDHWQLSSVREFEVSNTVR